MVYFQIPSSEEWVYQNPSMVPFWTQCASRVERGFGYCIFNTKTQSLFGECDTKISYLKGKKPDSTIFKQFYNLLMNVVCELKKKKKLNTSVYIFKAKLNI